MPSDVNGKPTVQRITENSFYALVGLQSFGEIHRACEGYARPMGPRARLRLPA